MLSHLLPQRKLYALKKKKGKPTKNTQVSRFCEKEMM